MHSLFCQEGREKVISARGIEAATASIIRRYPRIFQVCVFLCFWFCHDCLIPQRIVWTRKLEILDGMNANRKSDESGDSGGNWKQDEGSHRSCAAQLLRIVADVAKNCNLMPFACVGGLPTGAVQAWLFWPKETKPLWPLGF